MDLCGPGAAAAHLRCLRRNNRAGGKLGRRGSPSIRCCERRRLTFFFTGATASLRGGSGYAAFSSAKAGLRMVAQAMARELGPQNIHVAHLVIDAGVDTSFARERIKAARGEEALATMQADALMSPASIANSYWALHQQTRDAWTFELDLRPHGEPW